MNKEEIIINDIDVAECEFLRYCVVPDNEGCKIDDSLCCDVGNCYYKQLQSAKQKIERLENLLIKRLNAYQNQKKKLEQINEIVKKYQFCQQLIDIKKIIDEVTIK